MLLCEVNEADLVVNSNEEELETKSNNAIKLVAVDEFEEWRQKPPNILETACFDDEIWKQAAPHDFDSIQMMFNKTNNFFYY